jgi:pyruvate/2-oxoglutarate/acetoin dehydrogenase E1 component
MNSYEHLNTSINFLLVGDDPGINNAAKVNQMTGGQFNGTGVFRGPTASGTIRCNIHGH